MSTARETLSALAITAMLPRLENNALPPGAGLGNAQMDQLVAGTAAAGGGRSQMADSEGREGRWWPVGGLALTKLAARLLLEAVAPT